MNNINTNWIPCEIEFPNETIMVILPIEPVKGWAICIGKFPVTNKQYASFLEQTVPNFVKDGVRNSRYLEGEQYINENWVGGFYPWEDSDFNDPLKPVTCVSYFDTVAYVNFIDRIINKQTMQVSLPKPKLWDFAAFGRNFTTTNSSDWLNQVEYIHHKANSPLAIEVHDTKRLNFQGVSDLFGNVWEWCEADPDISIASILTGQNRKRLNPELRGGSFLDDLEKVKPYLNALSLENREYTKHSDLGFRISGMINLKLLPHHVNNHIIDFNKFIKSNYEQRESKVLYHTTTSGFDSKAQQISAKIKEIKYIQNLIAEAKLLQALDQLKKFCETEKIGYDNEILIYMHRLRDVNEKYNIGIIKYSEKLEIQTQIVYSVLELIDKIEIKF